jgi:hypothetical protein
MTTACDDILRRFAEEEIGRHDERAAFEAGENAAFIAAVDECQAYAEELSDLQHRMGAGGALLEAFASQIEDKVNVAQQIAMRIAQRAKRGEK